MNQGNCPGGHGHPQGGPGHSHGPCGKDHNHGQPGNAGCGGATGGGPKQHIPAREDLADGWSDKLMPLEPLDVTKTGSFDAMCRAMSKTAFGGRSLGEAADVLYEMVNDPKCFIVGTFSGAMTIAKQGLLITEMIDQGFLHAVVSTGALMCHGLIEQTGHTHFRYDPTWSDDKLYDAGYARVYDTLELESNLEEAADLMGKVLDTLPTDRPFGSHEINHRIGQYLNEQMPGGRGILQSAARKGVPVYVPAFTDSELGLDVFVNNMLARHERRPEVRLDLLRDIDDYWERCAKAEKLAIFTIGGGVPRNWAQQVGPLGEILHRRTDGKFGKWLRFTYAIRVCPEPVHWGGLSGCTYSEGVSWGKFVSAPEGGRHAEVLCDATVAWPILVRAVLERMGRV